jgi:hypothetical protein
MVQREGAGLIKHMRGRRVLKVMEGGEQEDGKGEWI